ncbi:MAG: hypothetical protein LBF50_08180 [Azoarcus sp.]|jgi:hypothetical protein|nr:hypothetical protein [Azoarcus sp.]
MAKRVCAISVAIKSGPNWGNSSQIAKMKADFLAAEKHCAPAIVCGQRFWQFISNNRDLYTGIIEPLAYKARERNAGLYITAINGCCYGRDNNPDKGDYFKYLRAIAYTQRINQFTREFANSFCRKGGAIDRERLVRFNSSEQSMTNPTRRR